MKKIPRLLLIAAVACSVLLSGCSIMEFPGTTEQVTTAPTEPETIAPTEPETTAPTEPETTAPTEPETTVPTEPLSTEFPYLKSLPAEACVFRSPDPSAEFSQTVEVDGVYTIMEEVRDANGQIWGRLKSGAGWVNLSDPFCHGENLPAVTASRTGEIIKNSEHHLFGEDWGEYVIYLTFMPHETVYNVKLVESHPAWSRTVATMGQLSPGEPMVVGVTLVDFNCFVLTYEDSDGNTGSVTVDQNYADGPPLCFYYD